MNDEDYYLITHKISNEQTEVCVGIFADTNQALGFLEAMMNDNKLFCHESELKITRVNKKGSNYGQIS